MQIVVADACVGDQRGCNGCSSESSYANACRSQTNPQYVRLEVFGDHETLAVARC